MAKKPSAYLKRARLRLKKRNAKKRTKKKAQTLKDKRDSKAINEGNADGRDPSTGAKIRAKARAAGQEVAKSKSELKGIREELDPAISKTRTVARKAGDTAQRLDTAIDEGGDPLAGPGELGLDGDSLDLDMDNVGVSSPTEDLRGLDQVGSNGVDIDSVDPGSGSLDFGVETGDLDVVDND